MEVADEMDDEAQRDLLVGEARVGVLEHLAEAVERLERIAFGRRMVVDDPVERHIMPRRRGLLPEVAGRRAHLVGPVGGLVEALARPEDLLDMGAGEAAQLRVGDRGDDPVAGLAPGEGGRRDQRRGSGSGNEQGYAFDSALIRFGMAGACPVRGA